MPATYRQEHLSGKLELGRCWELSCNSACQGDRAACSALGRGCPLTGGSIIWALVWEPDAAGHGDVCGLSLPLGALHLRGSHLSECAWVAKAELRFPPKVLSPKGKVVL
jgi:hypothetical protein